MEAESVEELHHEELAAEFPNFEIPDDIGPAGWWQSRPYESWNDAILRAKRQVARLIQEFGDSDLAVACVIHADFKAMMMASLGRASISKFPSLEIK